MPSKLDQVELMAGLEKSLSEAKQEAEQSRLGKGAGVSETSNEPMGIVPKGLRIKGKLVGQAELSELETEFNKMLDSYVYNSKFRTQLEADEKRRAIQKDFNKFQLDLIRRGAETEAMLDRRAAESAKKQAYSEFWGQIASGVGFGIGNALAKRPIVGKGGSDEAEGGSDG